MEKTFSSIITPRATMLLPTLLLLLRGADIVAGNSVELIGNDPKYFSGSKSFKVEPSVLPRVGGTHGEGLTITFWIMVEKYVSGWNVIFHCGPDPHRTPATWFRSSSTRVHPRVSTTSSYNEGSDSQGNVFDLNTWHHAAYVLNNNQLLFYVDGKIVMTYTLRGDPVYSDGTHPLFIGHDTKFTSFDGKLKYFRFYDFALSETQVKEDKSSLKPLTIKDTKAKCNAMMSFYESLVNSSYHSDVIFLVNGTRVYGHKCILSASSPYFKRLLAGTMKELSITKINITGVSDVDTFLAFMKYLYAGRVPSDPQEAIKLMITIDYFSVGNKVNRYKSTLEGQLSTSNACQLLSLADSFVPYQESLVQMIMSFMSKSENYREIINSDDLYMLPQPLLRKFLKIIG